MLKVFIITPVVGIMIAAIIYANAPVNKEDSTERLTNTEEVLRSIADNILSETTYDYIHPTTKDIVKELDENTYSAELMINSPYNEWKYWNGVLGIAMLDLYENLGDNKYKDFSLRNMEFAFEGMKYFKADYNTDLNPWHYPYGLMYRMEILDDIGAEGANLLDVIKYDKRPEYLEAIAQFRSFLKDDMLRDENGSFIRTIPKVHTLWADDLYMSVPLLARLGDFYSSDAEYQDAVNQIESFHKKLWRADNGLYYHCWHTATQSTGVAHWGRANGWVALAKSDLLSFLPEDHPKKSEVLDLLKMQLDGVIQYQDDSGLWHQVLDKSDSYLETSCSAMFTYAIAKSVNEGWIGEEYAEIALKGWKGLESTVDKQGRVAGICVGTGIDDNIEFYYNRPTELNDIHGLGAVLLAGVEIIKLEKSLEL